MFVTKKAANYALKKQYDTLSERIRYLEEYTERQVKRFNEERSRLLDYLKLEEVHLDPVAIRPKPPKSVLEINAGGGGPKGNGGSNSATYSE